MRITIVHLGIQLLTFCLMLSPVNSMRLNWNYKDRISDALLAALKKTPFVTFDGEEVVYENGTIRFADVPNVENATAVEFVGQLPKNSVKPYHMCAVVTLDLANPDKFQVYPVGLGYYYKDVLRDRLVAEIKIKYQIGNSDIVSCYSSGIPNSVLDTLRKDSRWIDFNVKSLKVIELIRVRKVETFGGYLIRIYQEPKTSDVGHLPLSFRPYAGVLISNDKVELVLDYTSEIDKALETFELPVVL